MKGFVSYYLDYFFLLLDLLFNQNFDLKYPLFIIKLVFME